MFVWSVWVLWLAQAVLILSGFGRSHLESQGISSTWLGAFMLSLLPAPIIGFFWYPGWHESLENYWWSFLVMVFFIQRIPHLWERTGIMTLGMAVMRHFGPLNPHRVTMVNWPMWESWVSGILLGFVIKDPVASALSAAVVTTQSSTVLSAISGHLHFSTARNLSFSLAATMIAWNTSWVIKSISSLWVHEHPF